MRAWTSTFCANVAIFLCGGCTGILAARSLLPEGRGQLAAIIFWPQIIAAFGILGLPEAVTWRATHVSCSSRTVSTAISLSLTLALITSAVGYVVLPALLGPARNQLVPLGRLILLLFIPVNFLALVLMAVDHGLLNFARYNVVRSIVPAVIVLTYGSFAIMHKVTVKNLALAHIGGTVAGAFIMAVVFSRTIWGRPAWAEAGVLLNRAVLFHATVIMGIVASQVDRLAVFHWWDNVEAGHYTVAFTYAASGLGIVTNTFHTVMFPKIGRLSTAAEQGAYLSRSLGYATVLLVGATAPLLIFSSWLIPFLFGREFDKAIIPSAVLCVAYIPLALRQVIIRSLRGLGIAAPGTVAEGLASVSFLLACLPLGRVWGISGVAAALLLTNGLALAYLGLYLRRSLEISPQQWLLPGKQVMAELREAVKHVFSVKGPST